MNFKTKVYLIGTIAIMIVIVFGLSVFLTREVRINNSLERSYAASQSVIKYYRTKNGNLAASHPVETYTVQQIKDGIVKGIMDEFKQLDLKPKNITNFAETVVQSEKQITTILRDSTIHDTVPCQVFSYTDPFYTVFGMSANDSQFVTIQSTDTIISVLHKKRKYPWLWFFSPKIYEQTVICKNPNNNIVYERYIEVK